MFKLVQTCYACPEQYNVYLEGDIKNVIGYMRLRHGRFYAKYCGQIVYQASTLGDGCFKNSEREYHLNRACHAIKLEMERYKSEEAHPIYTVERMSGGDWYPYGE